MLFWGMLRSGKRSDRTDVTLRVGNAKSVQASVVRLALAADRSTRSVPLLVIDSHNKAVVRHCAAMHMQLELLTHTQSLALYSHSKDTSQNRVSLCRQISELRLSSLDRPDRPNRRAA